MITRLEQQAGFSYVEVLVSMVLIAIMLVPAMDALRSGIKSTEVQGNLSEQHDRLHDKMEFLMSESHNALVAAAEEAGDEQTISPTYSDASGTENRIVVYVALYNPTDSGDPFNLLGLDLDLDLDGNPYTGESSDMIWIKAALEQDQYAIEALRLR